MLRGNTKALTAFDDKRFYLPRGVKSVALGSWQAKALREIEEPVAVFGACGAVVNGSRWELSVRSNSQTVCVRNAYANMRNRSSHAKFMVFLGVRALGYRMRMLFRLFSAIRRYSPLFSDHNGRSISSIRYF